MDKKTKLTTAVEKAVFTHVNRITEGSVDSVILLIRRNNLNVDRDSLNTVIDLFRKALASEHLAKLELFMKEIDGSLNDFTKDGK